MLKAIKVLLKAGHPLLHLWIQYHGHLRVVEVKQAQVMLLLTQVSTPFSDL